MKTMEGVETGKRSRNVEDQYDEVSMKTVLITGATGAIGSAITPLFLEERAVRVYLLLRADSEDHLQERFLGILAFWHLKPADSVLALRLCPLRGDVTQPLLGMPPNQYRQLSKEVTHVIHAAGNVKLNQSLKEARKDAVGSAREVTGFANACRENGQFRKLEYVSTVGVAGRHPGLLQEAPLTQARRFHNTYEEAKAEAENYILEQIGEGLPATVHRPSMVVGDSRTGKIIHFQVFYYLSEFCSGTKTWGIVAETGKSRIDIVPADYVARAIYITSCRQETAGRIFNLCSGPQHAMRLSEMSHTVRQFFQERGMTLPRLRVLHPVWLRRLLPLACFLAPLKMRRSLQSLPLFLDYLDEDQMFDNTKSQAFFSKEGLSVPPIAAYLGKVLQYYWDAKQR